MPASYAMKNRSSATSRSRKRTSAPRSWVKYHHPSGNIHEGGRVEYKWDTFVESINESSMGKGLVNRVSHYSHSCHFNLVAFSGYSPPNGGTHMTYVNEYWASIYADRPLAIDFGFRDFTLKDLKDKILGVEDMNLLDFLRTLKQIPELVSKFSFRPDKLTLAFNYGLVPTLKDIKDAYGIIKDAEKEIQRVASLHGKTHSVHLKVKKKWRQDTPLGGQFSAHKLTVVGNIVHRASARFTVEKVDPTTYNQILLTLQKLGLGRWASTAWEAIPFSFLLDWFWKVGNSLAQFDLDLFNPKITIWHTSRSVKFEGEFKVSCVQDLMFSPPVMLGYQFLSGTVKLYKREPFLLSAPLRFEVDQGAGFESANAEERKANALSLLTTATIQSKTKRF